MVTHSTTEAYGGHATAPTLLTIDEVASYLGISRSSVYALIRERALVPIRVRTRARFAREDIEEYISRCREGRAAP